MKRSLLLALAFALTLGSIVAAQQPGVNSNLANVYTLVYEPSTPKASYSAAGTVVAPSSATDILTIWGSSTKTIRVRRITVAGTAIATVTEPVYIIKRSTADTGGTSSIIAAVPRDSQFGTATARVESYTAVPTLGTFVGEVDVRPVTFNASTIVGSVEDRAFGLVSAPVVLRGAAQQLSVNLGVLTITGNIISYTVDWTEE